MKFCVSKEKDKKTFESFEFFKSWASENLGLKFSDNELSFYSSNLSTRLFVYKYENVVYISDCLSDLIGFIVRPQELHSSIDFYKKFGFILPPFTQYKDVYITAPYVQYYLDEGELTFKSNYPECKKNINMKPPVIADELYKFFSKLNHNDKFEILVSGGIDSSALLGFVNDKFELSKSVMCKMSSLPNEGIIAKKLSDSINIPFEEHDLDKDLDERATEFVDETGEYISDSISLVFPELFERIYKTSQQINLIDGQGADSLLNGLPLDKVYTFWSKLSMVRYILYPLSLFPIYKDKSTPMKRRLYRFSKALKCLTQLDFRYSILCAMTENETISTEHESYFLTELTELYSKYKDWHLVLRMVYLFRILPAREMQKYLLSKKYNINIVAPFLDDDLISAYLFVPNSETVKKGIYKYPITRLAQQYWPGYFETSKTSPFQINYRLGLEDIKSFSIKRISAAVKGSSNK